MYSAMSHRARTAAFLLLATVAIGAAVGRAQAAALAGRRMHQYLGSPPPPCSSVATKASPPPPVFYGPGNNTDQPVGSDVPCDCDHHNHGCTLSKLPPSGKACECKVTVAGSRCDGYITDCAYPDRESCRNPKFDADTCLQGKGDCDGYFGRGCDCDHAGGGTLNSGCIISEAAPSNTACFCKVTSFGRCDGYLRLCEQPDSPACKDPSKNLASCKQGGGDCDAYVGNDATCDCTTNVAPLFTDIGCKITRPAPANLACRCDLAKLDISDPGVCKGTVVLCANPLSPSCLQPSDDLQSCEQGKGKCLYL